MCLYVIFTDDMLSAPRKQDINFTDRSHVYYESQNGRGWKGPLWVM